MKKTPINRFSTKRVVQLQAEAPVRIALCERAGGKPVTREVQIYRKGRKHTYTRVVCVGGICECGLPDCPRTPRDGEHLEPHEKLQRSLGGVLSMDNTIMVLRRCHRILQHSEPMWSYKS